MIQNFLKLPKKTVDAIERKLARYITASQFLAIKMADDEAMRQLAATWPSLPAVAPVPVQPFEEPEGHKRARKIMGGNFFGIAAVQRHFGAFTEEELEMRREVRILNETTGELFTEEETLVILEECKDTHLLFATRNVALTGIHSRHKESFSNDRNAPFFSSQPERQKWSSLIIHASWILVRKDPVPDSENKDMEAQKKHVLRTLPKERMILPCEFVFAALLFQLETGKKLCERHVVRFDVQTTVGGGIGVRWGGAQLSVYVWDRFASPNVVSGSVRTS